MPLVAYSEAFAAPILWGAKMGFSLDEIADGLELDRATVVEVIEQFTLIRFPVEARARALIRRREVHEIDPRRTDAAYRIWAQQRLGATMTLQALGAA